MRRQSEGAPDAGAVPAAMWRVHQSIAVEVNPNRPTIPAVVQNIISA